MGDMYIQVSEEEILASIPIADIKLDIDANFKVVGVEIPKKKYFRVRDYALETKEGKD